MNDSFAKNAAIMIVDDKQANIDVLEGLLEALGYTNFKSITDSRLAINLFETFKPDLILLDLMMPYLNGFQVMEQLNEVIPSNIYLPILVLTADMSEESKQKALAGGAKDFLSKPFSLQEVELRIKNLLATRYLYLQLEGKNLILEKKVKKRTDKLERTIVELEIAKTKAEASDRLKTAFMNNISHEIRTPLNSILGFAPIIIQPDITMEKKERFLEILNVSSYRLLNTVTDYMDISLIVSNNLETHLFPINISSMLTNLSENFKEACRKKNIEIETVFPENSMNFNLNTDGELLKKALYKLVDNSVKFTKDGSITLGFDLKNNQVEIFVRDTGKGIEKDAHERIFECFMQEDISSTRGHEGSGLGLSIAKGIVELLGGKIQLESEKNFGTTVYLTLPNNTSATLTNSENWPNALNIKQTPNILIAEDDYNSSLYIEMVLEDDYKTLTAYNGQEAVDLCRKHPDINLVLMDIKMPVMNGIEATQKIKSFRSNLPIIAVTAHALSGDEQKIKEAGCDDYISKPIDKSALLSLVRKYFT